MSAQAKAQVNPFDWTAEFPAIFSGGGFDAIVMNPPWLMAGYYVKPALAYFQSLYLTATGKYDMYYLFIERALQLCSKAGRIGMIVPNKMFHTRAATALREAVADSHRLEEIVDFGDAQLFARATNYSCLLLLGDSATPDRAIVYARADAHLNALESFSINPNSLGRPPWSFTGSATSAIFARMRKVSRPLKGLTAHFGNGVQTGADSIYLVDGETAAELR